MAKRTMKFNWRMILGILFVVVLASILLLPFINSVTVDNPNLPLVRPALNVSGNGTVGPQGPQGPAGPIGPQGPAGINGLNGTNGINGTNLFTSINDTQMDNSTGVLNILEDWLYSLFYGKADVYNKTEVDGFSYYNSSTFPDNYLLNTGDNATGDYNFNGHFILNSSGGENTLKLLDDSLPSISFGNNSNPSTILMYYDLGDSLGLGGNYFVFDMEPEVKGFAVIRTPEVPIFTVQKDTGFVGINTSTPQSELNVIGSANITGLIYGNGSQLTDITLTEVDPLWTANYTAYNSSWSSITNTSYYLATNPFGFYNVTTAPIYLNDTFRGTNYSTFLTHITWANAMNGTLMKSADWNATNTSYYLTSNPSNYWNNTFATFNKTYADTLYFNELKDIVDPTLDGKLCRYNDTTTLLDCTFENPAMTNIFNQVLNTTSNVTFANITAQNLSIQNMTALNISTQNITSNNTLTFRNLKLLTGNLLFDFGTINFPSTADINFTNTGDGNLILRFVSGGGTSQIYVDYLYGLILINSPLWQYTNNMEIDARKVADNSTVTIKNSYVGNYLASLIVEGNMTSQLGNYCDNSLCYTLSMLNATNNPFNQTLNTTSDVTFRNITATNITASYFFGNISQANSFPNIFNQVLNTTSNVTFNNVTASNLSVAVINLTNKINLYNSIATEGFGVPAIIDNVALINQANKIASTSFNGTGNAGQYRVNYYFFITTTQLSGFVWLNLTWEDGKTNRNVAVANLSLVSTTTSNSYAYGTLFLKTNASNINYILTNSTTFSSGFYDIYFDVERMN